MFLISFFINAALEVTDNFRKNNYDISINLNDHESVNAIKNAFPQPIPFNFHDISETVVFKKT